jgi:hypothetical protein
MVTVKASAGKARRLLCGAAGSLALGFVTLVSGGVAAASPEEAAKQAAVSGPQSRVAQQLYLNGLARIARGNPAGAITPFQVLSEVAPELPSMHHSLAYALLLADFARRDQALAAAEKAVAQAPGNPLFAIVRTLSDDKESRLGTDGGLYLTAGAAETIRQNIGQLAGERSAANGRYLATVLGQQETTGDDRFPVRIAGFGAMLGDGGKVHLADGQATFAFGRLFAAAVPESDFAGYEPRMVARLQGGLDALSSESQRLNRIRSRVQALRSQLSSLETTAAEPAADEPAGQSAKPLPRR